MEVEREIERKAKEKQGKAREGDPSLFLCFFFAFLCFSWLSFALNCFSFPFLRRPIHQNPPSGVTLPRTGGSVFQGTFKGNLKRTFKGCLKGKFKGNLKVNLKVIFKVNLKVI